MPMPTKPSVVLPGSAAATCARHSRTALLPGSGLSACEALRGAGEAPAELRWWRGARDGTRRLGAATAPSRLARAAPS
jgi:hypothetical protein